MITMSSDESEGNRVGIKYFVLKCIYKTSLLAHIGNKTNYQIKVFFPSNISLFSDQSNLQGRFNQKVIIIEIIQIYKQNGLTFINSQYFLPIYSVIFLKLLRHFLALFFSNVKCREYIKRYSSDMFLVTIQSIRKNKLTLEIGRKDY